MKTTEHTTGGSRLYPLLFESNLHEKVWGGHLLSAMKGLPETATPLGESWEVSAVPSSPSVISNGPLKGRNLIDIVAAAPEAMLGGKVARAYDNEMPLLVKFIDAQSDLSIQVHPDDAMARRVCGGRGKTEMWYVLAAKPGAYLYEGFTHQIDEAEFRRRVADGTITDVLARHEVKAGDAFYIPAGTVHAICRGILVAEIQQSSDITYRIFDYNRPGLDGKPRELHVDLAAQAIHFAATAPDVVSGRAATPGTWRHVVNSPFFTVRAMEAEAPVACDMRSRDSFVILVCTGGSCTVSTRPGGDEIVLREGWSAMVPAAVADYVITPIDGRCKFIDAYL